LVKDYRIEYEDNGQWHPLLKVKENRQRKRKHVLDHAIVTERLRLVVEQTNGTPYAEVVEIRVR